MPLALVSLIAGVLTILSPCVLPLLPVIVGGAASETKNKYTPLIITASLAVSVIIFTLALKVSTVFIDVPPEFWKYLSGGLIGVLGLLFVFPDLWDRLSARISFNSGANKLLGKSAKQEGIKAPILIGAALGPVFTSCSPTLGIVLATVLPASAATGLLYLLFYVIGLSATLLAIAYAGQKAISKLQWASDPNGWFRRLLGVVFILVGVAIIAGWDKQLETYLIDHGLFIDSSKFEFNLIDGA